jgi:hypothetical protein
MKVKNFKFRDVQVLSKLVTRLELTKEQITELVGVLTGAQNSMLLTEAEVEKYLLENLEAKERRELYEETDGDFDKLREAALSHKGVSTSAGLLDVILKVVGILAEKFDVIIDFMDYYLEEYDKEQIKDMDEDESVEALMAVINNKGFAKFFSNFFNSK